MKAPDGSMKWQIVHRSEYIQDTLNPQWKPVAIDVDLLCQCDLDRPIRVSFFDWEESGLHNPMGHFFTTVNRLLRSKAEKEDGGDKWNTSKAFITQNDEGEEFGKIVVVDVSIETPEGISSKSRKEKAAPKIDKESMLLLTLEGVDMANVEGWFGCSGKTPILQN